MEDYISITLSFGCTLKIEREALDDQELLDALATMDEDAKAYLEVMNRLLGPEKKTLYEALRNESGRVKASAVNAAVTEILNLLTEDIQAKN